MNEPSDASTSTPTDNANATTAERGGAPPHAAAPSVPEAVGVHSDGRSRATVPGVLTYGFATALTMWVVAYLMHLPVAAGDATRGLSVATFFVLVALLFGGCVLAGRAMAPGWRAGLLTGLCASLLNLIVLAGLPPAEGSYNYVALLAGSVVIGAVIGLVAGAVGNAKPWPVDPERHLVPRQTGDGLERNWRGPFAKVAAVATLAMLLLGGTVTSLEAGLSVPDWPTTDGYGMIFYPLSQMTGDVYYEHTHRLFGVLIGLITAVLGFYLLFADRRRYVKGLAVAAMVLVIVQAVLGGFSVTLSEHAGAHGYQLVEDGVQPSLSELDRQLAVLHGVLGLAFFGLMLVLVAVSTTSWRKPVSRLSDESAGAHRNFVIALLLVMLLQILLGAVLRHVGGAGPLHMHIMLGVLGALFAIFVGMRTMARYRSNFVLHKLGKLLMIHAIVVVPFGFLAWVGGGGQPHAAEVQWWEAVLKTLHHLLGALLLGFNVLLLAWSYRLVIPASEPQAPAQPSGSESAAT